MGHGHAHHGHSAEVQPRDPAKIKHVLIVTLKLAFFTAVEFVLAFTMSRGPILTSIFVFLTLVKTFYIVGEFMHLKYEVKILKWAIILPTLFIMWLILAMLLEANHVHAVRTFIFG